MLHNGRVALQARAHSSPIGRCPATARHHRSTQCYASISPRLSLCYFIVVPISLPLSWLFPATHPSHPKPAHTIFANLHYLSASLLMLSASCVYGTYIPLSQGSNKIAAHRAMGRGTNLILGWSRGTSSRTSIECVNLAALIVSPAHKPWALSGTHLGRY